MVALGSKAGAATGSEWQMGPVTPAMNAAATSGSMQYALQAAPMASILPPDQGKLASQGPEWAANAVIQADA